MFFVLFVLFNDEPEVFHSKYVLPNNNTSCCSLPEGSKITILICFWYPLFAIYRLKISGMNKFSWASKAIKTLFQPYFPELWLLIDVNTTLNLIIELL